MNIDRAMVPAFHATSHNGIDLLVYILIVVLIVALVLYVVRRL